MQLYAFRQKEFISGNRMDRNKVEDWNKEARRVLKLEMAIRQISHKELLRRLERLEERTTETERSIASKISRGTFSAAFFLKCLRAMEVGTLDVSGKPVSSARPD
jgi:GTP-sensing pleiotropic transcriptional regulator CodY